MATKKRAATTKSKKSSTKRSAEKKASLKSGVSAKRFTKGESVIITNASGHLVKIIPGKNKLKVLDVIPLKGKVKFEGGDLIKRDQAQGSKKKASTPKGASSTAPVVYQTLRERAAAVEKNIGKTQSLKDFLDSAGWR